MTTTKSSLHPENETRLLSITVTDTKDQTRAILQLLAAESGTDVDLGPWHAFQEWIARSDNRVFIPYAEALAEAVPPIAVRLRRDFRVILTLIEAHAIVHQAMRERDANGRIVATLDDYDAVRNLVADIVAEGLEATVPDTTRETVEAVASLTVAGGHTTKKAVADKLNIDPAAAWRRCQVALSRGYLRNMEERKRRPAQLVVGDLLPENASILPAPASLAEQTHTDDAPRKIQQGTEFPSRNEADCRIDEQTGSYTPPSSGSDAQRERIVI